MIAQRFRALGWVMGIASAATGLYLISLQVAAERAKLEGVELRIAAAHRDMRQLQTELGTRASQRQLEKWNNEDLSLAAPRAGQYLQNVSQLAGLTAGDGPAAPANAMPRAVLAAASPPPVITGPAPEIARPISGPAPRLQNANYVPTATAAHPTRVAMVERVVLDRSTMGDLIRTAAEERRQRP
jgi:hypothetical protein